MTMDKERNKPDTEEQDNKTEDQLEEDEELDGFDDMSETGKILLCISFDFFAVNPEKGSLVI